MTDYNIWAERAIWALLVLFISPFIIYNVPQLVGLDAHIVNSGSMKPSMPPGSVIYEKTANPANLQEGDVIVFEPNSSRMAEDKVTHRIVDIREGNYTLQFKTMGDANPSPDPGLTPAYNIDGQKVFSIPYLGTIISVLKSPLSILAFVALPAAVLIRSQVLKIMENMDDKPRYRRPEVERRPRDRSGARTGGRRIYLYEPIEEKDEEEFH